VKLIRELDEMSHHGRGGAVTIGNFDGVHSGHVRILARLKALAREVGGQAVVFTFDPHPVRLLRPEAAPPPLTWTDRKADLLAQLGVDVMIAYPTDQALLALEPEAFFRQIILERLGAQAIVEGPNFFFGRNRAGNVKLLGELCTRHGLMLEVVPPETVGNELVSSSRVRELIRQGNVGAARKMLTEPYRIRGMITHGARRGATIGFPTANLEAVDTLLPAPGVYAGCAYLDQGRWPAAINIGPNPTFAERDIKVEAHLIGFHGSLYGQPLEVDFHDRLRDIRTFASVGDLKQQLLLDVETARRMVPV
jgi:riboflavin kinase / FMN adenylyltransferase